MARRKLGGLSGKRIVGALERGGFEIVRGSHHILRKPELPVTKVIVPVHGSHAVPPGTVRSIIKQSRMTVEEFMSLL